MDIKAENLFFIICIHQNMRLTITSAHQLPQASLKKSFHAHWNFSRYSLMDMKRSGQDLNLWHSWCYILVIFNYFRSSEGLLQSWSYGSWIYNYLCNQCPSPL